MSADNKTSKLYDAAIDEVTANGRAWKSICRLTGQIYRYEFDNILMVYMQRPGAKLVADFDTWKKVGRYVRRGSRGIYRVSADESADPVDSCRYSDDDGTLFGQSAHPGREPQCFSAWQRHDFPAGDQPVPGG